MHQNVFGGGKTEKGKEGGSKEEGPPVSKVRCCPYVWCVFLQNALIPPGLPGLAVDLRGVLAGWADTYRYLGITQVTSFVGVCSTECRYDIIIIIADEFSRYLIVSYKEYWKLCNTVWRVVVKLKDKCKWVYFIVTDKTIYYYNSSITMEQKM